MKNLFNVAVMALALCVFPINVAAQENANIFIVNSMPQTGVMHDETFEHSYVVVRRTDGSLAIGFYNITAKFERNFPVSLDYNLISSTDANIFKEIPVYGIFEAVGDHNAFDVFSHLFEKVYGERLVEIKFER